MIRIALGAALFVLAACVQSVTDQPVTGADLDGTYRLVTIDGEPIPGSADMTIKGRTVSGNGPCNAYWTTNSADWPAVALVPIATTRRACLVEGGEADFLAALKQTARARKVEVGLELTGPDHTMLFEAAE